MKRYVENVLQTHVAEYRQMIFLAGPRQVGKTTIARHLADNAKHGYYLNWDNQAHRADIVKGPEEIARRLGLEQLRSDPTLCVLDELHKYRHWRDFLKGIFDEYEDRLRILVTGSARFDTSRRGGDSLMGRYFPYTLHPLSVAESLGTVADEPVCRHPEPIGDEEWDALLRFGGFPEPFLKTSVSFYNRWRKLRTQQLFREDLRDLTRIQEIDQVELLAECLRQQVGQLTSYTYLSKNVRVSVDTVRRWVATLESFYYCFAVRPWHRNVARALRKEPKYYLWDWSLVDDPGARAENMVASALLKATQWWTETGYGQFALHFVRDKQKREVDFLVTRDGDPWFLAEVKSTGKIPLSAALREFQSQTNARHAFQVAMDMDFVERDCFEVTDPTIVPARTLLAQFV